MSTPEGKAQDTATYRWYSPELENLRAETREVLEKYSKIPPDEVVPHVHSIRDRAWAIHRYPCIGRWRFLELHIGQHVLYPEILSRMRSGKQIFLDLGCAFAQDIRRLVADGVDSSHCYGSDLRLDFIELGYDLFRDKDTLNSKFIPTDIFDASSPLTELDGKADIIGASSFFHLFGLEDQKIVARRVAKLMRPKKGTIIVGRQVGNETAQERQRHGGQVGSRYSHNVESWRKLWDEIGAEIGAEYEVDGKQKPVPETYGSTGDIELVFSVRRL